VDAGSAGYPTIRGLRKYVVDTSATRLYALIDIGALGLVVGVTGAMDNLDWVNGRLAGEAANSNKPVVVGISVRVSKDSAGIKDLEVLNRAREAAEISSLPIVVSIGDTYSPLPEILRLMRKGDVLTHCYTGQRNGLIDPNGRILPEVLEARAQGIIFDVGHGRARFSFNVAEKCVQQNFLPDTVSTDLSTWVVNSLVFDLPTTLSKFLLLGLGIDKVIGLATIKPAHVFNFGLQLGTLGSGAPADIAIFELREGDFVFVDSVGEKRNGRQKLISSTTIRNGEIYVNQSDK
jgi:dihydroorotase